MLQMCVRVCARACVKLTGELRQVAAGKAAIDWGFFFTRADRLRGKTDDESEISTSAGETRDGKSN